MGLGTRERDTTRAAPGATLYRPTSQRGAPEIHYALSGHANIAYQVLGDGPLDFVFVPDFVSNLFPDDPSAFVARYSGGDGDPYPDTTVLGPTPADAINRLRPVIDLVVSHMVIVPSSQRTLERFCVEVVPALG